MTQNACCDECAWYDKVSRTVTVQCQVCHDFSLFKYKDVYMQPNNISMPYIDSTAKDIVGKPLDGLVTKSLIDAIARVREYGINKYPKGGRENWRSVDQDFWYHALMRHVSAMCDAWFNSRSKETLIDAESGLSHAAHAAANLMFIIELMDNSLPNKELGKLNDPRAV